MHKLLTSTLAAVALTTLHSHALLIDFTAAEGYSDGDIVGQEGWSFVFGTNPLMDVANSATVGELAPIAAGGAVARTFSDSELGGTFDNSSSQLEYTVTFDFVGPTTSGFGNHVQFRIGSNAGAENAQFYFRQDGFISVSDGTGFSSFAMSTGVNTVDGVIDYATGTYTAFLNNVDLFGGSRDIKNVGSGAAITRFDVSTDGTNPVLPTINIDSVGLVIPEPTSAALMLGAAGLLALRRRRA